MLIHLPVVENRIAQFEARFVPHGSGWVYYGDRLDGGLPVTDAERTALLAEHARLTRQGERAMWWWLPVAVILCLAYEIWSGDMRERPSWHYAPVLLLPLPWVAWRWRQADRLAIELAGRRVAVMPPRSWRQGAMARMAALPPSIGIVLLIVSVLLAVQSRPWETGTHRLWLAEAVAGALFGAALIWIRRRARR